MRINHCVCVCVWLMCWRRGWGRGGLVCCTQGGEREGGRERKSLKTRERRRQTAGDQHSDHRGSHTHPKPHNAQFCRHLENEKQREFWRVAQSSGWGQFTVFSMNVFNKSFYLIIQWLNMKEVFSPDLFWNACRVDWCSVYVCGGKNYKMCHTWGTNWKHEWTFNFKVTIKAVFMVLWLTQLVPQWRATVLNYRTRWKTLSNGQETDWSVLSYDCLHCNCVIERVNSFSTLLEDRIYHGLQES